MLAYLVPVHHFLCSIMSPIQKASPALQHGPKHSRVPGDGVGIAVQREVVALPGPDGGCARADQHARHVQQPRAREQERDDEESAKSQHFRN